MYTFRQVNSNLKKPKEEKKGLLNELNEGDMLSCFQSILLMQVLLGCAKYSANQTGLFAIEPIIGFGAYKLAHRQVKKLKSIRFKKTDSDGERGLKVEAWRRIESALSILRKIANVTFAADFIYNATGRVGGPGASWLIELFLGYIRLHSVVSVGEIIEANAALHPIFSHGLKRRLAERDKREKETKISKPVISTEEKVKALEKVELEKRQRIEDDEEEMIE